MSTLVHPPLRQAPPTIVKPTTAPAVEIEQRSRFSPREMHRWVGLLVVPFILGAAFFAIAIGLDVQWAMAPAFLLGPLSMISGYIYLALTSDANRE
jgi:hypothetical protein